MTLDPDVEGLIRTAMKERGQTLEKLSTRRSRSGPTQKRPGKKLIQQTFAQGAAQNFRWDKALAAADALEDAELTR